MITFYKKQGMELVIAQNTVVEVHAKFKEAVWGAIFDGIMWTA